MRSAGAVRARPWGEPPAPAETRGGGRGPGTHGRAQRRQRGKRPLGGQVRSVNDQWNGAALVRRRRRRGGAARAGAPPGARASFANGPRSRELGQARAAARRPRRVTRAGPQILNFAPGPGARTFPPASLQLPPLPALTAALPGRRLSATLAGPRGLFSGGALCGSQGHLQYKLLLWCRGKDSAFRGVLL